MRTPSRKARGAASLAAFTLFAAGVLTAPVALAAAPVAQDGAPAKKDKKPRREIDDVFKRWLKEDVLYIISPEERKAFEQLATDEEREAFIEGFWLRRDPDPNTPENEYREEHHRRIAYANQHFTSGIPGWRTDRGRVYIAWGKPDSIESNPTGSQYQRAQYEGGGTTTTYAYETWWYRHLDGVGEGVELEFVDSTGTGEYRLSIDPREKDALAYVPSAGLSDWDQLGLGNKLGGRGGQFSPYAGMPTNKTPFARLDTWRNIMAGPGDRIKIDDLRVTSDLPTVETNALPFSLRTDFYRISDTSVVTAVTVQIENSDLTLANKGGVYEGEVNVYAVLTQLSGKGAGRFEDVIATPRYSEQNVAVGQQQKSAYQKNILLPPGNYKIELMARDTKSGKTGVVRQSFLVPRFTEGKLASSSVVLAQKIETATNRVAAQQFIVGKYKVIPNVSNVFRPGQPVGVFMQVYDTQIDQASLMPTVDVEYVISKDGAEVKKIADRYPVDKAAPASADTLFDLAGSQLVVGRSIGSEGLAPGTYKLQVRITDRVAQKTISPTTEFTIAE